jgi:N-acetylglucosaminyldiphosphoundecaprenol N-acetyl-beta-D-mannosaminyltransferase
MDKLLFTKKSPREHLDEKKVFNFLNMESLWQYHKNKKYKESLSKEENINFPDGFLISKRLKINQQRGPTFTRDFLNSSEAKNKRHLFLTNIKLSDLLSKTSLIEKKTKVYRPSFIKGDTFSKKELEKILEIIKEFNPQYVWIAVGSPKQEILGNVLYKNLKKTYFNVGAALDFLVGKKKESPVLWRKIGLEWFYQGLVNPKRSRKKIKRQFSAIKYLRSVRLKDES